VKRAPALALTAAFVSSGCTHFAAARDALSPREQAQVYVQKGHAERAYPLLLSLHAERPEDLDVARLLADAAVRSGQTEALAKALTGPPRTPEAVRHYMLGLLAFSQPAQAGAPALNEFRRAIEVSPSTAEFHYRLGVALLESERYADALSPLQQAKVLAPERSGMYLPLAKALARTGDTKGAVAALARSVASNPTPQEVAIARALMEQMADPFAGFPKAAEGKLEQGMAWLRDADVPQQAIIVFEEILGEYPDLSVVHALLGLSYERLDDAGRAVEELKRAIELAPEQGKNQLYLGELYLSRQRTEPAKEAFEKAVALDPLLDAAYAHLADLELEQRELVKARDHFRILTSLQPESEAPHGKLALVLQLLGDFAAAERELKKVVDRVPDNVEFILRLGLLHAERRQRLTQPAERLKATEEATKWLRRTLELQPENALASRTLETLTGQ